MITGPVTSRVVDDLVVERVRGRDGVVTLTFASDVLQRRTTAMAWLPPEHVPTPWPVLYHLHGTVGTTFTRPVERWADRRHQRGLPLHPALARSRRRAVDPDSMGLAESRPRHRFLVVAPDAGDRAWCTACNWIDARPRPDGRPNGVLAEQHLHDELLPLVEEVFETRTDRGGRAVMGHSMGGGGAMIQAFRHPDRFTFVGSSSGTLTVMDDFMSHSGIRWAFYNRTQGFRPIPFDRVAYQNHNLVDLAPNVRGIDLEIVAVIGDGELHLDTAHETYEGSISFFEADDGRRAEQTMMERWQRRNNDLVVPRLREAGVQLTYVTREGIHEIGPSTFRRHFLPRLHERFEGPAPDDPVVFTHRRADDEFDVFAHRVRVRRDEPGFLTLANARTDGTRLDLVGHGQVELVLPVAQPEGRQVRIQQPGRPDRLVDLAPTPSGGRVEVELDRRRHLIGGPGRLRREAELDHASLEVVT